MVVKGATPAASAVSSHYGTRDPLFSGNSERIFASALCSQFVHMEPSEAAMGHDITDESERKALGGFRKVRT